MPVGFGRLFAYAWIKHGAIPTGCDAGAIDMGEEGVTELRLDPAVGLCSACLHAERVVSGRGSVFWFCGYSRIETRYLKYPPLPVLNCSAFEPGRSA
jgi:hypothetical protein